MCLVIMGVCIVKLWLTKVNVMMTRGCNLHPLTPLFYIVKLGFTGVYIFAYFRSKT